MEQPAVHHSAEHDSSPACLNDYLATGWTSDYSPRREESLQEFARQNARGPQGAAIMGSAAPALNVRN
jgi:hypothetical protein